MPSIVTNQATESTLRSLLEDEGFTLSTARNNGETGVDILATRKRTKLFIEVIGHKSSPPARSKDFYESFFRAISRIKDGAQKCVIALPSLAGRGLPARARHYGDAWTRIGTSFPELQIWLVDTTNSTYTKTQWNDWSQ
jgi:hypothetical protein